MCFNNEFGRMTNEQPNTMKFHNPLHLINILKRVLWFIRTFFISNEYIGKAFKWISLDKRIVKPS